MFKLGKMEWSKDWGLTLFFLILEPFVINAVNKGEPTCFNDIFAYTYRCPDRIMISAFNNDSHLGGSPCPGVYHPDLIVRQMDFRNPRMDLYKCFAQGSVKGVDRAVPFAYRVYNLIAHAEFNSGLGDGKPIDSRLDINTVNQLFKVGV